MARNNLTWIKGDITGDIYYDNFHLDSKDVQYRHLYLMIKAVVCSGETIGFLCAGFQDRQQKGLLVQPIVKEGCLDLFPAMLYEAGAWLEQSGRKSMIVEIPDQWTNTRNYLLENRWKKKFTWLELVRWLDEKARINTTRK